VRFIYRLRRPCPQGVYHADDGPTGPITALRCAQSGLCDDAPQALPNGDAPLSSASPVAAASRRQGSLSCP
jgi:hypothetical protein